MNIKFYDWDRVLFFDELYDDDEEFEFYVLKNIFDHHRCYVEGACVKYFSKYNNDFQPLYFDKKTISTVQEAKEIIYNSTFSTFCKFFKTLTSYEIIHIYDEGECFSRVEGHPKGHPKEVSFYL